MTKVTTSQQVAADIVVALKARNALLWIKTGEVSRVERYLNAAANAATMVMRTWDCADGVCNAAGTAETFGSSDLADTLKAINARSRAEKGADRGLWILRNAGEWLGPVFAKERQSLINLARSLPTRPVSQQQTLVVLASSGEVMPDSLKDFATVINWPLPDRDEIADILDRTVKAQRDEVRAKALNGNRDAAINAALGLTEAQAQSCFATSLIKTQKIDVAAISGEKKQIIEAEGVLTWFDPIDGGLDAVGGLNELKAWLRERDLAYSADAREYGLPTPKGVFMVGVPGCGKTLIARALAAHRKVPCIKFDMGVLKGPLVGESEGKFRKATQVADVIGPCVLLIDEIEKQGAGATQGAADGGVSANALQQLLTWMNDRTSQAFIVATANNVINARTGDTLLPPELLRDGRFDARFFVDLPNTEERRGVLYATLRKFKRHQLQIDLDAVADAMPKFSGAEVAAAIPAAMFAAFADNKREINTGDVIEAARKITPLAQTMADQINALRQWAGRTNARNASTLEVDKLVDLRAEVPVLDI